MEAEKEKEAFCLLLGGGKDALSVYLLQIEYEGVLRRIVIYWTSLCVVCELAPLDLALQFNMW